MQPDETTPHVLPFGVALPEDRVVLVDAADRPLGTMPKLAAHLTGMRHRAVSVVLTDGEQRILLQRRAAGKYHSAGLWSNTACGHPRVDERPADAALRRLVAEMGIRCDLAFAGRFGYRAVLANGLIENEVDHVFVGLWQGEPRPNPAEVAEWEWVDVRAAVREVSRAPGRHTAWLAPALVRALGHPLFTGDRPPAA